MKTIHKFPLEITDEQTIKIPEGAEIISLQMQYSTPCIWAIVDTDNEIEERRVLTFGTGHIMGSAIDKRFFIDTYQFNSLVLHVFLMP